MEVMIVLIMIISKAMTSKKRFKEAAEVGVKLQPISSLVDGNVGLRRELQNALQQYIHSKQKVKCK